MKVVVDKQDGTLIHITLPSSSIYKGQEVKVFSRGGTYLTTGVVAVVNSNVVTIVLPHTFSGSAELVELPVSPTYSRTNWELPNTSYTSSASIYFNILGNYPANSVIKWCLYENVVSLPKAASGLIYLDEIHINSMVLECTTIDPSPLLKKILLTRKDVKFNSEEYLLKARVLHYYKNIGEASYTKTPIMYNNESTLSFILKL